MKSIGIIGFAGKGLANTPLKIDNVKDLHTNFGKQSNIVSVAEHLIYEDYKPILVRLEDYSNRASANLYDDNKSACVVVSADSPGFVGGLTTVEITRSSNSFNILVFNSGEMVEFWGDLTLSQAEEIVNFASKWINISVIKNTLPQVGVTKLKFDNNELKSVVLEDITNIIDNLETEFISMPDCNDAEIISGVLNYLEINKPTTILIIDSPWDYDLLETYKWCKNLIPSDNGVVFWPWLREQKSVPPSGPVLSAIFNWPLPWKPVRTKLAGVSGAMQELYKDELVYLSRQEHFINILSSLVVERTILTLAGHELNERRLVNFIKSEISKAGIELLTLYEPTSNVFRNNFIESSEYILEQVRSDQGINNYSIQIDELGSSDAFNVNIELVIKDSVEIVNIWFKFAK